MESGFRGGCDRCDIVQPKLAWHPVSHPISCQLMISSSSPLYYWGVPLGILTRRLATCTKRINRTQRRSP